MLALAGTVMEEIFVQDAKANSSIVSTDVPRVMVEAFLQTSNACAPIYVTELGMLMEVRLEQLLNEYFPMDCRVEGNLTFAMFELFLKASLAI